MQQCVLLNPEVHTVTNKLSRAKVNLTTLARAQTKRVRRRMEEECG